MFVHDFTGEKQTMEKEIKRKLLHFSTCYTTSEIFIHPTFEISDTICMLYIYITLNMDINTQFWEKKQKFYRIHISVPFFRAELAMFMGTGNGFERAYGIHSILLFTCYHHFESPFDQIFQILRRGGQHKMNFAQGQHRAIRRWYIYIIPVYVGYVFNDTSKTEQKKRWYIFS